MAERIGAGGRPRPLRLAVLITHPIQYFKPVFQALAQGEAVELLVVFGCDHGLRTSLDPDFGVPFAWDSSPAEGFPHGVIASVPLAALSDWRQAFPLARRAVARIGAFRPDAVLVFAYTPAFITIATLLLRLRGQRLLLRADGTDRAFARSPLKSLLKDVGLRCWYGMFQHVFPIAWGCRPPGGRRCPMPWMWIFSPPRWRTGGHAAQLCGGPLICRRRGWCCCGAARSRP